MVKRDRTERVGANETHFVAVQMNHNVENDQSVVIGANSTTQAGNDYRFGVTGNRAISVGGNETIDVGATASTAVFANDSETVGGARITLAGLTGEGSINRRTVANLMRSVGGAFLTVAVENVQTLIKKNYVEAIGGIKLTVTKKGSISQVVSGEKQLTVGGSVIRTSGEDMGIGTKQGQVTVGASANLRSAERVEFRSKAITLEAASSFTLSAPGLEISLTPGKTALKGKVLLKSGDKVMTTGGPDNITK